MRLFSPDYEEDPLFVDKLVMTKRLLSDTIMLNKDSHGHKKKLYAAMNSIPGLLVDAPPKIGSKHAAVAHMNIRHSRVMSTGIRPKYSVSPPHM